MWWKVGGGSYQIESTKLERYEVADMRWKVRGGRYEVDSGTAREVRHGGRWRSHSAWCTSIGASEKYKYKYVHTYVCEYKHT